MTDLTNLAPVYDLPCELNVLGLMMAHPECLEQAAADIAPTHFFDAANHVWAEALFWMHDHAQPIGVEEVKARLELTGRWEDSGKEYRMADFLATMGTSRQLPAYLNRLKDLHQRRHTLRRLGDLAQAISIGDVEPATGLEDLGREVARVGGASQAPRKSKLTIRTVTELLEMEFDNSDNYFGDRVIAEGQNVTILGPGGVGKSRLVLQLAIASILGRPLGDMATHAGLRKWLFIQSENSNRRLQADLAKQVAGLDQFDRQKIDACLFLHTIETEEDAFLNLEDPERYREIEALVMEHDPTFVVFDPANTFTALDLNADRDMRMFCTLVSRVTRRGNPKRVAVVLHHSLTGKAGAARSVGWDKGSYGRNSKVLLAWTRAQINIAPQDPENPSLIVMSCGKNNNGRLFPDLGLRLDEPTGLYVKDESFDPEAFREAVGLEAAKKSAKVLISATEVAALFESQITKPQLAKLIQGEWGICQRKAYDVIDDAEKKKFITASRTKGPHNTTNYTKATFRSPIKDD